MTGLNDFLVQMIQPYFFYSIVFLSIALMMVTLFLRRIPLLSRRIHSFLWLVPLIIPIFVLLLFNPQTEIPNNSFVSQITVPVGMRIAWAGLAYMSFTGLLCISGCVAAAGYLLFMLLYGHKVALKHFHVVMLSPDEYVPLQEKVTATARRLNISEPKVGLVDDLLPNSFTIGYGQNTVVVFSLGLIKLLDLDELTAVVCHELSHIKSKDYFFKSISGALNLLSFYNPLAYIAASNSQKERELIADERAASLNKPESISKVLMKVQCLIEEFPKPSLTNRFSSSLFLVSSLAHKPNFLSSHPQISQRVQNIHTIATHSKLSGWRNNKVSTLMLLCLLACTSIIVCFSTIQAQSIVNKNVTLDLINGQSIYVYNASLPFDPSNPTGICFHNESDLQRFTSAFTGLNQTCLTLFSPTGETF